MRRSKKLILAAAGTLAVGMLIAGSMASWAQLGGDDDPCRTACRVEKSRCVDRCSSSGNPVECEAVCHDLAEDCTRRCN